MGVDDSTGNSSAFWLVCLHRSMYPDQGLSGGVSEAVGCLDRASPLAGESKCRPERCGGALGPWKSGDGVESVASCSAHCQLRHGVSFGVDTPARLPHWAVGKRDIMAHVGRFVRARKLGTLLRRRLEGFGPLSWAFTDGKPVNPATDSLCSTVY